VYECIGPWAIGYADYFRKEEVTADEVGGLIARHEVHLERGAERWRSVTLLLYEDRIRRNMYY
jgi:hypothetical protein